MVVYVLGQRRLSSGSMTVHRFVRNTWSRAGLAYSPLYVMHINREATAWQSCCFTTKSQELAGIGCKNKSNSLKYARLFHWICYQANVGDSSVKTRNKLPSLFTIIALQLISTFVHILNFLHIH